MTDADVSSERAGIGRLGTIAAWVAAVCCLPYLVLKVAWTLDWPLGLTDESLLDSEGWVAANALMAVVQLTGLVLVLALVRQWARRVPAWLLLLPVWVGTGLLLEVAVGAMLMGLFSPVTETTDSDSLGGIAAWVYILVYASFAGQGAALAVAFACHVRARWGNLLQQWTQPTDARLATTAQAVAAAAVAVAPFFVYWAAGGTGGLSGDWRPAAEMQAARLATIAVVVSGLLLLAGWWGARTRLWLPVALLWLGSGGMVAFDALSLVLYSAFGSAGETSSTGWSPHDTVVLIKVLIGVAAAAVGVRTIVSAAGRARLGPREAGDRPTVGIGRR